MRARNDLQRARAAASSFLPWVGVGSCIHRFKSGREVRAREEIPRDVIRKRAENRAGGISPQKTCALLKLSAVARNSFGYFSPTPAPVPCIYPVTTAADCGAARKRKRKKAEKGRSRGPIYISTSLTTTEFETECGFVSCPGELLYSPPLLLARQAKDEIHLT